jgi:hypothetical protein
MRVLLATVVLVACGPSDRDNPGTDAPSQTDAPSTDAPDTVVSRIFAHSGTTLYQMDQATLATTDLGSMTGLGTQSLTDLAVDKDDRMLGVTLNKLYEIDATNGAVTLISELDVDNATSLSFVPLDPDDPDSADILVTANSFGDVFQIDPATGASTLLGNYGVVAAGQVRSSGDLFAVRGLGIFATVDIGDGSNPNANDFLARIDPETWVATPIGTGTGFDKIFGVGFWGGKIYGFVDLGSGNGGKMIDIDINTGVGTELSESSQRWFGAGVATDAPILL